MKGKEKCKILKEIRAQIAAANDIAWITEECPHKGDCRGTCPRCEAEVRQLERELARRRALGKTVAVVGLSAGIITTTTACAALNDFGNAQLDGDMIAPISTTTMAIAGGMTLPPETTDALDGDIVPSGVPLPPPTTEEIPELGGEPLPVYYLTDFTLYESERLLLASGSVYLDEVIEDEEIGKEVREIPAGDVFAIIGDDGYDYMFLVRYKDKLYAVEKYYLDEYTTEYTPDNGAVQ